MNKEEENQHGQQTFHLTLKMSHQHKFQSGHILAILEPCNRITYAVNIGETVIYSCTSYWLQNFLIEVWEPKVATDAIAIKNTNWEWQNIRKTWISPKTYVDKSLCVPWQRCSPCKDKANPSSQDCTNLLKDKHIPQELLESPCTQPASINSS